VPARRGAGAVTLQRVDEWRLAHLRRWAGPDGGVPEEVREAARAVVAALDDGRDPQALADAGKWAERTCSNGRTAELRSAARTVLSVLRESNQGANGAAVASPLPRRDKPRRPPRESIPRPRSRRAAASGRLFLLVGAGAGLAALLLAAVFGLRGLFAPSLSASGPPAQARLGPTEIAALRFTAEEATQVTWTLDGRDVTARATADRGRRILVLPDLADGSHRVEVRRGGGLLGAAASRGWSFIVDTTPPRVRLDRAPSARRWQPLALAGAVEDGARVTLNGRPLRVRGGRFELRLEAPLPDALTFDATDLAGNRSLVRVPVSVVPRRPPAAIRAVHVTAYGWADRTLRAGVLNLIAQHRVNAIEIDLKDESGIVGFAAPSALGRRVGAVQHIYDLDQVIRRMHARGIRVIGRLVCFRDPLLAAGAWKAGDRDQVIQTPGGQPYSGYGGFTNFANPIVRRYNIEIALAAARAGIDDVLYDYVRRPDGPRSSMVFPGLRGTPERAIVRFLHETRLALRPFGTYLGASVFGVAATRPREVAQDIPSIGRQVDYVAPMVYPSHWAAGEYDVANPNAEPYKIVLRSLRDFSRDLKGTGARVVPWLQDFSLGLAYGPNEVRAQIDAARTAGIREFILWDPAVTYTEQALSPDAPIPTRGWTKPGRGSTPAKAARASPAPVRALGRMPNELGEVPVIMHHEIRPDRVGPFDQTPDEFRHELEALWSAGYWPTRAADYVTGKLGSVPAGKTPVLLTFDDTTQFQFRYRGGKIDPTSAVGVLLAFKRTHSRFPLAGTFYVLREPFAGVKEGPAMLRWLVVHGFELGDHTYDHIPLNTLDAGSVQKEIVRGAEVIEQAVPHYKILTMALPLGGIPKPRSLARQGSWGGRSYRFKGVFLDGGNPAPSPYARSFDPGGIPRIRSSHLPWNGAADYTWEFWRHQFARNPRLRYVSDGDPTRITFPRSRQAQLARRYRARARPY
jgi:hypothetical protein